MDQYFYEGLVGRLEAQAERNPVLYRSQVFTISCLAYVVLFVSLCVLGVLVYVLYGWAQERRGFQLIQVSFFALSVVPLFYAVLRMFFMRLPPPDGTAITRKQAPKLFDVLDKMRRKLDGPLIHHVVIDDRYNAAISQVPRWGLFGGHTNYLILGLPYLLAVPPKEMLATIAHEYGHLCGNHGKLGSWIYRQRRTFIALYEQVDDRRDDSWLYGLIASAMDRFMPYYQAYTFVLSRQNEYEADLTATQLVGAEANASGLIRDTLLGDWFHREFWGTIYRQANTKLQPTLLPYASMRTAFKANYEMWATPERLKEAWHVKSGLDDTHPAMRDRVEATGQPPHLPANTDVIAADALLDPDTTKQLISEFDRAWWKGEQKEWQARHRYVMRSRQRLRELEGQPLTALALHDLQEFALLTAEFQSPQAAKPVLEHLLKQAGGPFPKASYTYGRILLDEGNDHGLDYLETAAKHDRSLTESAANLGYHYQYEKRGESAAQIWWHKVAGSEMEAA